MSAILDARMRCEMTLRTAGMFWSDLRSRADPKLQKLAGKNVAFFKYAAH